MLKCILLIALTYCAYHADENKPKQLCVCMKNFQIPGHFTLRFSIKKSKN